MIVEVFCSGPVETNAYLLVCPVTKEAAVIDVPLNSADKLMRRATELGAQIQMILLTHSHWDHMAEVALLKERVGSDRNVPVYVHPEDVGNLQNPGSDRLPLFIPVQGCQPDVYLYNGQMIPLGTLTLTVIHTPGHTPGGVCFYLAEQKVLISGDTLFCGTMGNISFPTAQPQLMWASLKKLATLPPEIIVYPGHGGSTTIGKEHWIADPEKRFS